MNNRLINTKVAGGGGGCTDIVDNYDPFGGNGVALYQLNGNANDVSGNYNGTATSVTYGTGVFGQAGVFNGGYISVDSFISNSSDNTDFSISFWINSTADFSTDRQFVFGNPTNSGAGVIDFELRGTATGVQFDSSRSFGSTYCYDSTQGASTKTNLSSNTWYHIVVIYQRTGTRTATYYVNGNSIGSQLLDDLDSYSTFAGIAIGATQPATYPELSYKGSLDQVRFFNTALDPLEVEALYTEELCICDGTVDTLDILGDGSCIATYQLDGNANDLSGNYSGTPTDVSYGVGEFDLAGVFNGSTSKVILPTIDLTTFGDYTISLWVKGSSLTSTAISSLISFVVNRAEILMVDGDIYFFGNTNYLIVDYPFNSNNWYNIVLVNSGTSILGYINGVSQSGTTSASGSKFLYAATIGVRSLGQGDFFNGSIDQVRIFNKALNSTEVTTLYNETACTVQTRTSGATQILGDSSCIAYFKLDGNATDKTGNYTTTVTEVDYGTGEFGQAGYFNQVYSSRIEANAAILPSNIFSVSLWMKVTNLSDNKWILTQYTGGVAGRFVFNYNADGTLQINTPVNSLNSITAKPIRNNVWQHIVLIKNGGSGWEIYVDNQSIGTWSDTTNITTDYNTVIGGNQNITDRSIDGQLDNIRIFNKAVSASEVTTLYNEGL